MPEPRRILVTAALPYANGPIHIGHLVEYIQRTPRGRYCNHHLIAALTPDQWLLLQFGWSRFVFYCERIGYHWQREAWPLLRELIEDAANGCSFALELEVERRGNVATGGYTALAVALSRQEDLRNAYRF